MNLARLEMLAAHEAATAPLQLRAEQVTIDEGRRTISCLIAPYGPVGYTSLGPTIYQAGFLNVPDDLRRVKMLVQHDQYSAAVGIGASFSDSAEGASMTFHLPEGPESDAALRDAANGLRDGVSIGATITSYYFDQDDNLVVLEADLYEVSLVTIPAFTDARALDVAAARKELPSMTPEQQIAADLQAGRIDQAEANRRRQALVAAAAAPAVEDNTPTPQAVQAAAHAAPAPPVVIEAQADPVRPGNAGDASRMSLRAAANTTLRHLQNVGPQGLQAALSDILVSTSDEGEGMHRPQFIGEVWSASRVRRPLIDAMTRANLEGVTIVGWRWVETPQVAEYEGNKTDVPSNVWKTETVTGEPQMFAGGWDVERKFIDLGAAGIVEIAFAKATEDYMKKSEAYAVRIVKAAATKLGAQESLPVALGQLGLQAASIGAEITVVLFGAGVWADFVNMPDSLVPWWLKQSGALNLGTTEGNAGGIRFAVDPALGAREFLAGDGQAATWYEKGLPIYVRAENIPQGGVDLGVFGYGGVIVNDSRAIFTGTVTALNAALPVRVVNADEFPGEPAAGA